jgi:hypothetical protein
MATTEQRLAALVLRRGDEAYRFVVSAPDFVRHFPVCWSEGEPDYGELRLDAAWTPIGEWSLQLEAGHIPRRLAILDSNGKALGQLECAEAHPHSGAGAPSIPDRRGRWSIGLLRIDGPQSGLGEVKLSKDGPVEWRAAADHQGDPWLWMCWQSRPPDDIYGRGVHAAFGTHAYRLVYDKRDCRYYQDGTEVPRGAGCNELNAVMANRWYEAFGPNDCSTRKLCDRPSSKGPADSGAGVPKEVRK